MVKRRKMKHIYISSSMSTNLVLLCYALLQLLVATSAIQCGRDAPPGSVCAEGFCCSNWGWCGRDNNYCGPGNCQSQCPGDAPPPPPAPPSPPPPPRPTPPGGDDVSSIITEELFEEMLPFRNDPRCPARGFYTYESFVTAARFFPGFGTTGTTETRTRELAAFLAQTSHETTGGWNGAPGGRFAWGYCFVNETSKADYCQQSEQWPCAPGKQYYGRGPIQISYNFNYGPAGVDLGLDRLLLNNPDLVAQDPVLAFQTAIWFWMTPQYNKPSCHAVMIGEWVPSPSDLSAGRLPGFGVTTNIINGGLECGHGFDERVWSRISFFERYCGILGITPGDNLDCYNQRSFSWGLLMNRQNHHHQNPTPYLKNNMRKNVYQA